MHGTLPDNAPENAGAARAQLAAGAPALVWRKLVADTETPVGAALKLIEPGRGDFLLESVEGGSARGRYSLLGLDPDLMFRATGHSCEVNRNWQLDRAGFEPLAGDSLAELRQLADSCQIEVPKALPPALACLVGYFGYETIGLVEKLPRARGESDLAVPDMLFARPTLLLVFDGLSDELFCIAPLWSDASDAAVDPDRAIERAGERIDAALSRLAAAPPPLCATPTCPRWRSRRSWPMPTTRRWSSRRKSTSPRATSSRSCSRSASPCPFPLPPFALYRALRRVNPSPFLYFLDLPGFAVVGSSPEILVRVRDGEVTIRPIAGTRPRGKTDEEDRAAEASLLADPKECAEHLMLLDLGRNDVGRVAAADSVKVTASFTIERYSHVMHIVSNVVGRLASDKDALDALFAGFPAGTVSGAPKVRACQIIAELEPETRGPYAGGVGYFAPDGSVDSCIVLRTAVVKNGVMHVQAGAGIVADSVPEYEAAECRHKAGALIAAAREAARIAGEAGFGQ